jgi:hypothetical protein
MPAKSKTLGSVLCKPQLRETSASLGEDLE